jgi:RHS repeat-associated protein
MIMPELQYNAPGEGNTRFGFNGKENDDEVKGKGNALDFGARIYDARIGRWLSLDPEMSKYPYASPYNFALNNPIVLIDPDGGSVDDSKLIITQKSKTEIQVSGEITIKIAVVNLTNKPININHLTSQANNMFGGTIVHVGPMNLDEKGNYDPAGKTVTITGSVKVNIEITEIKSSVNAVSDKTDHIMIIANEIDETVRSDDNQIVEPAGIAELGGTVSAIEGKSLNGKKDNDAHLLGHELGHNMSLNPKDGTLMDKDKWTSNETTASQKGQMVFEIINDKYAEKFRNKKNISSSPVDNKDAANKFIRKNGIK